jgi:hypothetical protein
MKKYKIYALQIHSVLLRDPWYFIFFHYRDTETHRDSQKLADLIFNEKVQDISTANSLCAPP